MLICVGIQKHCVNNIILMAFSVSLSVGWLVKMKSNMVIKINKRANILQFSISTHQYYLIQNNKVSDFESLKNLRRHTYH
jgi:hypothetical protein